MQKKLDDRTIRNLKPPPSGRLEIWDKLLPGFGLRVTENDVRTYFVMYRTGFGEGRKQRRYRLGDAKIMTLGEAREAARTALNKVARGIDPAEDRVPVQGIQWRRIALLPLPRPTWTAMSERIPGHPPTARRNGYSMSI